jgi:hypothetical protein
MPRTDRLIWTDPANGRLCITVPAFGEDIGGNETEAEYVERVAAQTLPPGVSYQVVPVSDLPTDRTFRNAWTMTGTDMAQARTIWMDRIRAVRNRLLTASDAEYLRAMESNDSAELARLRTERQAWRDIPQTFDLSTATTPTELRALWPAQLPRE